MRARIWHAATTLVIWSWVFSFSWYVYSGRCYHGLPVSHVFFSPQTDDFGAELPVESRSANCFDVVDWPSRTRMPGCWLLTAVWCAGRATFHRSRKYPLWSTRYDKIHMSNFVWSYRKHDQTWTYYKNQKQFETTAKRSHGHHWKPTNGPSACRMVRVQTRIDFLLQDIMVTSITGLSVHISSYYPKNSKENHQTSRMPNQPLSSSLPPLSAPPMTSQRLSGVMGPFRQSSFVCVFWGSQPSFGMFRVYILKYPKWIQSPGMFFEVKNIFVGFTDSHLISAEHVGSKLQ